MINLQGGDILGKRKGQAPKSYEDGTLERFKLQNRTKEERHAIAMKGVEARRKKKQQTMHLQQCMRQLLEMRTSSSKQKQALKKMGFTDDDLTNKTVLMVALFRKGLTGDVGAIREIIEMMDKLDLFEQGKETVNQAITINLIPTAEYTHDVEELESDDIWKAENGIPLDVNDDDMEEWDMDDNNWGNDVYNG